jgi:CBS domain-containing protein
MIGVARGASHDCDGTVGSRLPVFMPPGGALRPVVSARKRASARDIALQLLTGLYSGMPVTDEEGRVVGVITELDLLKAVAEGKDLIKTTAEEIMNREVMTANVETPVDDLIKIMAVFAQPLEKVKLAKRRSFFLL